MGRDRASPVGSKSDSSDRRGIQKNRLNDWRERLTDEREEKRCTVLSRLMLNKKQISLTYLTDSNLIRQLCTSEESRKDYINNLCIIFYYIMWDPWCFFFVRSRLLLAAHVALSLLHGSITTTAALSRVDPEIRIDSLSPHSSGICLLQSLSRLVHRLFCFFSFFRKILLNMSLAERF
jgi:hypothetical protein